MALLYNYKKYMTKIEKTLLGFFIVMFTVPEIFWSPVGNSIYTILQNSNSVKIFRPNFLIDSDNTNLLLLCLAFQLVGLIGAIIFASKIKYNLLVKSILILILVLLLLVVGFIFYIVFSLRHGIGF